jgi:hypothetical protein
VILRVFLRIKIFGELSVEYLDSISREIFVGYFEKNFVEKIDHYILLKFILHLGQVQEIF